MDHDERPTVWERLYEYALTQEGTFTSQEVTSWFGRHAPGQASDGTVRVHVRGASWNVDGRSQFASREPFLTRVDRGLFRRATPEELASWRATRATTAEPPAVSGPTDKNNGFEWFTEENTQSMLVGWLQRSGWTIVSTANTATRQHGVDVVAERGGERLGVEVKGYPSLFYVAGSKKGQRKTTTPENQAPKWFAHALVPAMRLREREPESRSVMCFPNFPIYRKLFRETRSSLRACGIEMWLVSADGHVEITE